MLPAFSYKDLSAGVALGSFDDDGHTLACTDPCCMFAGIAVVALADAAVSGSLGRDTVART